LEAYWGKIHKDEKAKLKYPEQAFVMVIQYQFGQANIIHTDNGSEFRNSLMTNITDLAKIDNRFSTAYHPQGHGTIERRNRDITESLRKRASAAMNNWPAHCSYLAYCLNTRINKTTNSTPFSLMFGREPNGYEDYRKCPLTQNSKDHLPSHTLPRQIRTKSKIKRIQYYLLHSLPTISDWYRI
jgi:transposase InsO family protein